MTILPYEFFLVLFCQPCIRRTAPAKNFYTPDSMVIVLYSDDVSHLFFSTNPFRYDLMTIIECLLQYGLKYGR